jgi:hypothetical protein
MFIFTHGRKAGYHHLDLKPRAPVAKNQSTHLVLAPSLSACRPELGGSAARPKQSKSSEGTGPTTIAALGERESGDKSPPHIPLSNRASKLAKGRSMRPPPRKRQFSLPNAFFHPPGLSVRPILRHNSYLPTGRFLSFRFFFIFAPFCIAAPESGRSVQGGPLSVTRTRLGSSAIALFALAFESR